MLPRPRCPDTRARAVNVSDPLTFAVALPGFKYALTNLVMDVGKAGERSRQLAAQRARHRHRRRQAVVPAFGEGRLLAFDPHGAALAWSFAHGAGPAGRSGVTRSLPFARHRVRGLTDP